MFKVLAAAAVAAVVVTGLPTVSEAGHERGARECRICKVMVRHERPVLRMPKIELGPRDPLFVLAPRKPRVHAPRQRIEFRMPKIERAPRDPLFVLAPRQPRVHAPRQRIEFRMPKIERAPRDPLFVLAPRQPRAVVSHARVRMPLFTRGHRAMK